MQLDEFIDSLQSKIRQYRTIQQMGQQIKTCLKIGRQKVGQSSEYVSAIISKQMTQLRQQASERISAVGAFCQNLLDKQRTAYEQQVGELRGEISRQYKVITLMRQELEDLMAMLNQRRGEDCGGSEAGKRENEGNQGNQELNGNQGNSQTINGLEIIEEEETDRTLLSSVHSFTEEGRFVHSDNFIRIEQKSKDEFQEHEEIVRYDSQCQLRTQEKQQLERACQEEGLWNSTSKFDKLLDSQASRRNLTCFGEHVTEDGPSQWESMPLSAEGQLGRGQNTWESRGSLKQLREITNENQKERQSKSKMFLQQFRKTFNKCLSSTNVSRKSSKSNQSKPPKDKSRSVSTTTLGKLESESTPNNQKMINAMLRDIDNNNKFAVGSRRSQLKYEGQRKDGNRIGQGMLYYSNGLSYEGEFRNNLRHGLGVLRFNQIEIYRGQWASDQLSGQGKIRNFAVINKRKSMVSGSPLNRWVSYCGSFRGNRFEGQGTLYLQGGEKFLGRFICGSACGEGTLYRKNGEVESGVWRHNQLAQPF